MSLSMQLATAHYAYSQDSGQVTIAGTVDNAAGKLVSAASVRLEQKGVPGVIETKTDALGIYVFSHLPTGSYILVAEGSGLRSQATAVVASSAGDHKQVDLILDLPETGNIDANTSSPPSAQAIEFADKPNFTIAGMTDWTAVGGHGSDSSLRTSEALTRETLTLKPEGPGSGVSGFPGGGSTTHKSESQLRAALVSAPESFQANHDLGAFYLQTGRYRDSIAFLEKAYRVDPANARNEYDLALAYKEAGDFSQARDHVRKLLAHDDSADLHRLSGELDEKLGDPLAAVHEEEQAVRLDPSEQNYFEWGSELLLHRAVWQAVEVFGEGARAYPKSARMLAALGTALFAGALYDEAALRLCDASDLNPSDQQPYIFMGKIEMAAPKPLACIEQRLARFARQQPESSVANYLYAMAIWKKQEQSPDPSSWPQVESLLEKAVTADSRCSDAYLQLGILYFSQKNLEKAIGFYTKAIAANPQSSEAHYRLGVAYDRIGQPAKAKQEFQLHDQIEKLQAAAIERQRREVKQFLVVLHGQPAYPVAH